MEFDQMVKLIEAVSKSSLTKFNLKEGNMEISLEIEPKQAQAERVVIQAAAPSVAAVPQSGENIMAPSLEGKIIHSPLVGTFYNTPSPDAPPFVSVGDTVKKGQVLAIVEAMKLMNEIESEYDGVVEEILADNESMVEYGQPLFRIG